MDKKEIRTLFTESTFTHLCKIGFITHQSSLSGKNEIRFTKNDISNLSNGLIIEKEIDDAILKFALQDIGYDLIIEILKRSPIYSEICL